MQLYDVSESVEEGWPVSADLRRNRAYLSLGHNKRNHGNNIYLRFGSSIAKVLFEDEDGNPIPANEEFFDGLYLTRGALAFDGRGVCLVKQDREDRQALLRAVISPGICGKIMYLFNTGVDVIAEGVMLGTGDERIPVYVLRMKEGSCFEISRDGDLGDLPAKMAFTWDGSQLHVRVQ